MKYNQDYFNSLSPMNQARLENALNRKYNFGELGIHNSYKDLYEKGDFCWKKIGKKSQVIYNRIKFNRMNHEEQKEYQKKLDTMIPDYRLYIEGEEESFYSVPKMVYEYLVLKIV